MPPNSEKGIKWDPKKDCTPGRAENQFHVPSILGAEIPAKPISEPVHTEIEPRPGVPGVLTIVYVGDHETGAQG